MTSKPFLCLNMIVKNESHIIQDSLKKLIKSVKIDYYVISDTGSTDNTKQIIIDFFNDPLVNIKGEIFDDEWKDFGYNRTKALEHAYGKSIYLLIHDADDEIKGELKLPISYDISLNPILGEDSYFLNFGSQTDISYSRIQIINNNKKWKYIGVLHESITCVESHTSGKITGDYYIVSGRSGDRSKDVKKYLKDALVLEKAYEEAVNNNDGIYNRYAYYCANSYRDANNNPKALEWYIKTLTHNNWEQEKYNCCINIFNIYKSLGQQENGFFYLIESFKYDKERVECLYELIVYYCRNNLHDLAYNFYLIFKDFCENKYLKNGLENKLFVDNSKYNFFLPYYMIIVCDKVKQFDTAIHMYRIIFTKKHEEHSKHYIGNVLFNLQFFIEKVSKDDTEFFRLFKEYIDFLFSIGYPVNEHESFMHNYEKYGIILKVEKPRPNFCSNVCISSNKILFYTGFAPNKWNYTYSKKNALGGSETAVSYLVNNIPKNFDIYVVGDVEEEKYDNVNYVNLTNAKILLEKTAFNTIIISRYISFYEMFPNFSCYKSYIWGHDTSLHSYGSNYSSEYILKKWDSTITGCICQTLWHQKLYSDKYPILKNKIININNGINPELFIFNNNKKISNKFLFSSCAERGLDNLIELWDEILQKIPDAQLSICSYNKFPKNADDIKLDERIKTYKSINHLGKLSHSELYELMASVEYWLYPSFYPETSCITSLEMLASKVICLYYPEAGGLINTLGDYGIKINKNNAVDSILELTDGRKREIKDNGYEYAISCSWSHRANEWLKIIDYDYLPVKTNKWVFLCESRFILLGIDDYMMSLKTQYDIEITDDIKEALSYNPKKITFIMLMFNKNILSKLQDAGIETSVLNTEPLNNNIRLEALINSISTCKNLTIYDYSISNVKILNDNGITNTKHLPYIIYKKENDFLRDLYLNTVKVFDFGLISDKNPTTCIRRRVIVDYLETNGFSVNVIGGWGEERDKKLATCKVILNLHGFHYTESLIFEHIRCDRLLNAGFKILSEISLNLDESFKKSFPNLKFIEYEAFKQLKKNNDIISTYFSVDETKKNIKIIDCFTFYNDVDLLIYRLNLLYDIVDYFIIVEASLADSSNGQKMCFKENEKLFEKFKDKIIHIVIDNANIDISKNQQFVNEKMQRNNISHGIEKLSLNNDDVIIISNLDEIPDPNLLLTIKYGKISIEFNCLEQDFYCYNLNNKMKSKWYYSKIISYNKYKEINKTCDDIRHTSCIPIPKAGWHLSYFGSTEFIKNKNHEFSNQEYNKLEFLDLSVITDKIIDEKDLFNHQNDEAEKIAICDNTYLPPLYEKYLSNFFKFENICFIHSCNLESTGTKKLEYLVSKINKSGAVKIFDKIIINNIGIPIENIFGEKYEVINYSENSLIHEIPTLNKLKHLSESIYNIKILYLHTKGITWDSGERKYHEKSNYAVNACIDDWVDMMLYFLVEKHQECISKLNSGYDSVGCNYLEACSHYPKHYSGNFWWANSKHIKNLPFIEENNTNKMDAEFWLFKNKHDYFTIHNSNVHHYLIRYPPNKYIE